MAARLQNVTQSYAWGSTTLLARLRGLAPSDRREAEIWMGAHPRATSMLPNGQSLLAAIGAAPERWLGESLHRRYGPRLPFLLKLIAIEKPLSLQAHPSAEQAALGYDREQALGVPLDSAQRNYVDPSHKPELLVALSEMRLLVGLRPPSEILRSIDDWEAPALQEALRVLRDDPSATGMERLIRALMTAPPARKREIVAQTRAACSAASSRSDEHPEYAWVARLGEEHPEDIGVTVCLFLNPLTLTPGQAVFLPARTLHAYLSGLGVEVMAASDNVLRGGLTSKHVDVDELLGVLSFETTNGSTVAPRVVSRSATHVEEVFPAPASEFSLSRVTLTSAAGFTPEERSGPEILLAVAGSMEVHGEGPVVSLAPTESAFVAAGEAYALRGSGVVFRARSGAPEAAG